MKRLIGTSGLRAAAALLTCVLVHGMASVAITNVAAAQQGRAAQDEERRAVGPPIRLVPGDGDEGREDGSAPRRDPGGTRADTRPAERRESPGRPAVRREDLGPPSLENYGTLPVEEGGFGLDMWGGARRALLEDLIPRLPARSPVPAVRELTRRLLLTPARVPAREAGGTDLLAARAGRLIAMGRAEDAAALLEPAREETLTERRARLRIEALFLTGERRRACDLVRSQLESRTSRYLDRAMVVCHVLAGDHARAEVGVSLMREQGDALSETFETLVAANRPGTSVEVPNLAAPDAFTTVLLVNARLPLPADFVATAAPPYLAAAAAAETGPPTRRIAAAERAAAFGALPPERLAALYRALALRTAWYAAANRITLARYDVLRRAMIYQAAAMRAEDETRLSVLQHWWRLAEAAAEPGHAFTVARLSAPLADAVRPGPDLVAYAAEAGRAAFRAGDEERGFGWYQVLANSQVRDRVDLARLALLARLSGRPAVFGPGELEAWMAGMRAAHGPQQAMARVEYLYALMDGIGEAQAQRDMWLRVLPDGAAARFESGAPGDLASLRAAARRSEKGPAILILLARIGNRSLGALEPATIRSMLVSLRDVDLGSEARRMAVEAALARGL